MTKNALLCRQRHPFQQFRADAFSKDLPEKFIPQFFLRPGARKPAPQTPLLSSESLRQPPLPSARLSADCAQEPEKKAHPRKACCAISSMRPPPFPATPHPAAGLPVRHPSGPPPPSPPWQPPRKQSPDESVPQPVPVPGVYAPAPFASPPRPPPSLFAGSHPLSLCLLFRLPADFLRLLISSPQFLTVRRAPLPGFLHLRFCPFQLLCDPLLPVGEQRPDGIKQQIGERQNSAPTDSAISSVSWTSCISRSNSRVIVPAVLSYSSGCTNSSSMGDQQTYSPVVSATACPKSIVDMILPCAPGFRPTAAAAWTGGNALSDSRADSRDDCQPRADGGAG